MNRNEPTPPHDDESPTRQFGDFAEIDQLLSDHLDGRLEGADLAVLQQMLADDAALRGQWEAMSSDRKSIRMAFTQVVEKPVLSSDFASRTVAMARQRAISESVSVRHPLRRLPEQTIVQSATGRTRLSLKWVSVIAASAAALIAVIGLSVNRSATINSIAGLPEVSQDVVEPRMDSLSPAIESVASSEPFADSARLQEDPALSDLPRSGTKDKDSLLASKTPPPKTVVAADASNPPEMPVETNNEAADSMVAAAVLPSFSGVVIVYDIELTMLGKASGAIRQAMQQAGIDEASEQAINSEIVGATKQAADVEINEEFRLLYLRDSAKKLDRLFSLLLADSEGVAAVGMTLVTDTPLLKLSNDLKKIEPTNVRQSSVSVELSGDSVGEWGSRLRSQDFIPMQASGDLGSASDEVSSGSDVITEVILLVR